MAKHWLEVRNEGKAAEILIQGQIGKSWWDDSGTSKKEFTDALNAIPEGKPIIVGINSEGGSIQDGLGIYNAIRRRSKDVTVRIDGYAVSIASVIPLAADKRISPKSSIWMIHEPWMMAMGSAEDMRKAADSLDAHAEVITDIYAERTSLSKDDARKKMQAETWFRGEDAVAMGFATESNDGDVALNCLPDPKLFKNIPDTLKAVCLGVKQGSENQSQAVAHTASLSSGGNAAAVEKVENTQNKKENSMSEENKAAAPAAPVIDLGPLMKRLDEIESKLPKEAPGAPPVPMAPGLQNKGDACDKMDAMASGPAKRQFIVNAWPDLLSTLKRRNPQNSNTISATLTTSLLSETVITNLQNKLAPIQALFTEVGMDTFKPLATVVVPNVTAGPTVQTDPTDWESGNSTVGALSATMHEYSASFHCTNAELQSGNRIGTLAAIAAQKLADKILDVVATNITVANYGAAVLTSAAVSFSADDLRTIWAAAKDFNARNLVIDGGHWARLIPTSTEGFQLSQGAALYGFDGIWYSNRWSAAGANVIGFVASPEAMAIVMGLPLEPPGMGSAFSAVVTAVVPGVNVAVQSASWFKAGTRVQWSSLDVMLGTAVGDSSALKVITSA